MRNQTTLETVSLVLVVIGGLNWGLVGLFEFNLVDTLFREGSLWSQLVYILVGLAALHVLYILVKGASKEKKPV